MKKLFFLAALLCQAAYAADVAISALPAASTLAGTEVVPVVQSATTKKATITQILAGVVSPTGANPTASVGLSAVNGSATTFLRSDGSPALDQSIAPTWTGIHLYSLAEPRIKFNETDQGTDLKLWDIDVNAGALAIRTRTDADGTGTQVFLATRSTTTSLSNITLGPTAGGNPTYTLGGAGTLTTGGGMQLGSNQFLNVGRLQLSGTTAPTIGFYTATSTATAITSSAPLVNVGTKFTAVGTGCTIGATTGGHSAGLFTLAAGPCTSVVVTMNGATGSTSLNGWTCQAHDRNTSTALIGGESSSTATTATFTIPVGAGTTDVISFSCTGF